MQTIKIMIKSHILGFPRMGVQRELKFALERHWRGECTVDELEQVARDLRRRHWQHQRDAGLDLVAVGDFALYDHVAHHIQLLGCEPARFGFEAGTPELARYFTLARGVAAEPAGRGACGCAESHSEGSAALEMTKWFDTNYHYLVPEFSPATTFKLSSQRLFDEVAEAQALGHPVKPVLLGPLSFLWLGKVHGAEGFDRLSLLDELLPVYLRVLERLKAQGVQWVQMDEPVLGLDLPGDWALGMERAYHTLHSVGLSVLLATYFSPLEDRLSLACKLPVAGLHVDAVRSPQDLQSVLTWLPPHKVLSVGVVDGRNIWRTDLDRALAMLAPVAERRQGHLWVAPSCSLLHVPMTLSSDPTVDPEVRPWLAGALASHGWQYVQKGDWPQGEQMLTDAIAMLRRNGDTDTSLLGALRQLGESQRRRGEVGLAFATFEEAYAQCRETGAINNLMCATIRANRAGADALRGNGAAALAEADLALAELRERFPNSHDEQAQALESRAAALFALSRHDDAVAAQREAVALFQQIYGGATRPAAQASLDRYLAAAAAAN